MIVKPTKEIHINIKGINFLNGTDNELKKYFLYQLIKTLHPAHGYF